jgi:hypothetical protein
LSRWQPTTDDPLSEFNLISGVQNLDCDFDHAKVIVHCVETNEGNKLTTRHHLVWNHSSWSGTTDGELLLLLPLPLLLLMMLPLLLGVA